MDYRKIRYEKLARYLAEGMPLAMAGKKAGYLSFSGAKRAAEDMYVCARIAELVNEGLPETLRSAAELDAMLDEMLDADVRLYFDEYGRPLAPTELRNAEAAALTGYKQGPHGVELKFESKKSVLQLAMQRRGMLIEKHELTGSNGGPVQTINAEMSASEAAELYRAML